MKTVKLNEEAYNKLKNRLINEISYDMVSRASDMSYEVFHAVRSSFETFYDTLKEAMFSVKYDSKVGQQNSNPYLDKVKNCADIIYDILNRKEKQENMFNQETSKVDHKLFNNSEDAQYNDIDDMDLRYLQDNFPRK